MMTYLRNNLNISCILLCFFLLFGCKEKEQKQEFYYAYYTNNDSLPEAFIIKKISNSKYRKEDNYMFRPNGVLKNKESYIFDVTKTGLKKHVKIKGIDEYIPYLSIENQESVIFKYPDESLNDFASTTFCFIRQEDINIKGKKYIDAYKFRKEVGDLNSVVSYIYYDKNFIPILEEFIEGGRPYFKIERLDSTLNFKTTNNLPN